MKTFTRPGVSLLDLLILAALPVLSGRADTTAPMTDADTVVKSITLPHFEPELPDARGRKEFIMACNSCHSTRYITMQPVFPRHKWVETVAKMIKTYGAHTDDAQAARIVDYLVSLNGTDEPVSATNQPPRQTSPPAIMLAADPATAAAGVQHGATLFAMDCAGCHGPTGRGDGIVSPVLVPKPVSLASIQYSVPLLSQVLWNGVPGSCMPSWRDLPPADVNGLAAYVLSLHSPDTHAPDAPGVIARGQTLFKQDCATCHGVLGDGNSAIAASLVPPPASFKLERPDYEYILHVLDNGVPFLQKPFTMGDLAGKIRELLDGAPGPGSRHRMASFTTHLLGQVNRILRTAAGIRSG